MTTFTNSSISGSTDIIAAYLCSHPMFNFSSTIKATHCRVVGGIKQVVSALSKVCDAPPGAALQPTHSFNFLSSQNVKAVHLDTAVQGIVQLPVTSNGPMAQVPYRLVLHRFQFGC
jgi:hypothetical protein